MAAGSQRMQQSQRTASRPMADAGVGAAEHTARDHPAARRPKETPSAQLSRPGWEPPRQLDRREWLEVGRTLGRVGRYSRWWVGDWLLYGDQKWGEMYKEAGKVTGYNYGTLRNIVSIAQKFQLSRRRDNLSWGHHADIASLPPAEQEYWLDRATELGLSREDLRIELRTAQRSGTRSDPGERDSAECGEHTVRCANCGFEFVIRADAERATKAAEPSTP
jgi:hypothetical protein